MGKKNERIQSVRGRTLSVRKYLIEQLDASKTGLEMQANPDISTVLENNDSAPSLPPWVTDAQTMACQGIAKMEEEGTREIVSPATGLLIHVRDFQASTL